MEHESDDVEWALHSDVEETEEVTHEYKLMPHTSEERCWACGEVIKAHGTTREEAERLLHHVVAAHQLTHPMVVA